MKTFKKDFDVVILSAGRGSRLQPTFDDIPKGLIQIGLKTILEHQIGAIKKFLDGNIYLVTGYKRKCYHPFVGQGLYELYNNKWNLYDNIYSLYYFLESNSNRSRNILIINSDTLFDLRVLEKVLYDPSDDAFACDDHKILTSETMRVRLDTNRCLLSIGKEIPINESDGEYIGLAKLSPNSSKKLYYALSELISVGRVKEWYEAGFDILAKEGTPIIAVSTDGLPWIEIDTLDDVKKAIDLVKKDKIVLQ